MAAIVADNYQSLLIEMELEQATNVQPEDLLKNVEPVTASYNTGVITARTFLPGENGSLGKDELMIDECLYNQVFGGENISEYELQPIEQNMPYIRHYDKLPEFLENSFYFRFKDNKINFSTLKPDYVVLHYKVMQSTGSCGGVAMSIPFECVENHCFKQHFRHEVRVVKYQKMMDLPNLLSPQQQAAELSQDSSRHHEVLQAQTAQEASSCESNILVLHDFHQHPVILQQLAAELYPKTVYMPLIHDIMKLAFFSHETVLKFAVSVLKEIFEPVQPIDSVGHGISCIIMQELSNALNIDNLVFCNPPAHFKYVFSEQQVIKSEYFNVENESVYTDSRYSGFQQLPKEHRERFRCTIPLSRDDNSPETVTQQPHEARDAYKSPKTVMSQSEFVDKYYSITASGSTEKLTCPYNEILERKVTMMGNTDDDVIQIEEDNEIYKVVNDILARISSLQKPLLDKLRIKQKFHSRKQLGFVLVQFTRRAFKTQLLNLLVFAPNSVICEYIKNGSLFGAEYFEQMPKFYDLLSGDAPHIVQNSVHKVVLFPSNSAYLEEQTVEFFREVDDRDGDFFVRSIVGCGYDMFQCVPQIIANLLK